MRMLATLIKLSLLSCVLAPMLSLAYTSCERRCYKPAANPPCRPECYSQTYYNIDYACVDFCLDYEHSLTKCQKSCTN